ncbi:hypothetical protein CWM57_10345 [Klebsiella sp. G-Nf4]|nr:hypothetical protein CWM64_16820 [Klebsiella sp. I-Nf8]PJR63479.1 hypothetical protein CWM61_14645 [Klebsiella sp. K-Nf6]PJX30433.1 hypothetical protein CWM53_21905 [Klebsiella sp. A-Nf5]PJX39485.1 hypothetical protein CWM59_01510 [Klebsiella sp. B-Nf7]PJX50244.1 hypothetical protein CWM60_00565 [Klebsiella sp. C1-16S-Nf17]PJX70022.1 hypothetical protein CWM57_10345 [Klebsiella sp. G-Nf4]PJX75435.1 hypothetical protein CWM55_11790 [Klebsiella sp. G2-16S-Nf13]PKJ75729.1 hypothetical protei
MRIFCQKRASLSVLVCGFILSGVNLACFDPVQLRDIGVLRLVTKSIYARKRPGGMLLVQLLRDISPASYKPRSFLAKWIDSTDVDRIIPGVSLREALASQGALSSAG